MLQSSGPIKKIALFLVNPLLANLTFDTTLIDTEQSNETQSG
jgi:hypothetical protein